MCPLKTKNQLPDYTRLPFCIFVLLFPLALICTNALSSFAPPECVPHVVEAGGLQKAYLEGRLAFINDISTEGNPYWESDRDKATEWALGWREQKFWRITFDLALSDGESQQTGT